jgi:predicted AAA+ superfamily ATPase
VRYPPKKVKVLLFLKAAAASKIDKSIKNFVETTTRSSKFPVSQQTIYLLLFEKFSLFYQGRSTIYNIFPFSFRHMQLTIYIIPIVCQLQQQQLKVNSNEYVPQRRVLESMPKLIVLLYRVF